VRFAAAWVLGLSLLAACSPPEVRLVPAPEWPAPAARGAFVGIFDADGALTVYPHKPGGANPMPWVPHTQPLSVAAGVVEQIDARTPPGGITWLPVPEGTNSLRVTLNVWRWEAFREDAWGVPEEFTAWFVPSRQACPRFRVEPVGIETEPSTTASRRLTTLTAGAVASIPEDWRLPSPPSYRVWNAEGLGPTVEGTAPMWSCAARGLRLLIDGTRYATLVDDAAPWPVALSEKKVLTGPTGVNRFGPCVALTDGWGAVTADGSGFFRLAEKSQVRRVRLEFQDTSSPKALLVTDDDTPVAYFPRDAYIPFIVYSQDGGRTLPSREWLAEGIVNVAGDIIAWGHDWVARLVVDRNAPIRLERYSRLSGRSLGQIAALLEYRDGLLALAGSGEIVVETAGGTLCPSEARLPQALDGASVEGVVVGGEVRIVVSEVVGNTRRFTYYTLVPA
jgi:hypothetical protein